MKFTATLGALAALGAAVATASHAQETTRAGEPLQPVHRPASQEDGQLPGAGAAPLRPFLGGQGAARPGAQDATPGEATAARLEVAYRQRLAALDLDTRMDAFDAIAAEAAGSTASRRALEAIAADTVDVDLAFAARLALREADRASAPDARRPFAGAPRSVPGIRSRGGPGAAPADPFESMREQMDALFGADPFANDPFFAGRGRLFGPDPFGGTDPFEHMRQQMEEMRRNLDALQGGAPGSPFLRSDRSVQRSGMSVSITPDGIRVEITEDDGDGPKTEVYEAPSKEELLRAHPELKDRLR